LTDCSWGCWLTASPARRRAGFGQDHVGAHAGCRYPCDFPSVQFTPDLLPADITGTLIYSPHDGKYHATKGPVFANFVLADEINRAPAKVQSALLETMQERQVTLGGETMPLPSPFLVLATENPIDQEGTYPLPEAQVDRFMFKVLLDYPTFEEERKILDRMAFTAPETQVTPVIPLAEILETRKLVDQIHVDEKVRDYVVHIVFATRKARPVQARSQALHSIWRLASGYHLPDVGGQSLGAPAGPCLRDARGRKEYRPRRAAPPAHPHLRGRSAGGDDGHHYKEDFQRGAGALMLNPKPEYRDPKEGRNPKAEDGAFARLRSHRPPLFPLVPWSRQVGVRISVFGFLLGFSLRPSGLRPFTP